MAVGGVAVVVVAVAVVGHFAFCQQPETIQGQVEVTEYRVSSKVAGRILELRVKEGDYVRKGDTLAIIDAPEVRARLAQAQGMASAANAADEMARSGARQEQVRMAYQVLQQTKAGFEIAKKSYERVQRLFDEGVLTEQKRDEAFANYKAMEAQVKAAQSQYDMTASGARREERAAAAAQAESAQGAVDEVQAYISETVQVAQAEGEVTEIYPKVGELVATGSPIMSISTLDDLWGTFNVREDQLGCMAVGSTIEAYVPAFGKTVHMKVFFMKDEGSYAVWKATKANGQYDLKTFEVKARPVEPLEGLRPGMSLVISEK